MDKKRKRTGARGWTVAALALLIAYPLSVGPVQLLTVRGALPEPVAGASTHFYVPLQWTYQNSPPPIQHALEWYVWLWCPDPRVP